MSGNKKALGKGLGALLKSTQADSVQQSQIRNILLESIVPNPWQPRKTFSDESIRDLAQSIQRNQLLQPVVLRKNGDKYELVNGERRFRAFLFLGRETIPAILRDFTDQEMLVSALVENIQRENLNPVEEAGSLNLLIDEFGLTHEELARNVGKSRPQITNSLRLLKLPKPVLDYVESGLISPGAARALLTLPSEEQQKKVASEVIVQGLNVRQIEKYVKDIMESSDTDSRRAKQEPKVPSPSEADFAHRFHKALNLPCKVKLGKNKGILEIQFSNQDQIKDFLESLESRS